MGAVSAADLQRTGLSRSTRDRSIGDGLLVRLGLRSFAIGGSPPTWEKSVATAIADLDGRGFIAGRTAARLHGLDGFTGNQVEALTSIHHRGLRMPFATAATELSSRPRGHDRHRRAALSACRATDPGRTLVRVLACRDRERDRLSDPPAPRQRAASAHRRHRPPSSRDQLRPHVARRPRRCGRRDPTRAVDAARDPRGRASSSTAPEAIPRRHPHRSLASTSNSATWLSRFLGTAPIRPRRQLQADEQRRTELIALWPARRYLPLRGHPGSTRLGRRPAARPRHRHPPGVVTHAADCIRSEAL